MNNIQVLNQVIDNLAAEVGIVSKAPAIKGFVVGNGAENLISSISFEWSYKTAAKICAPAFDVLENAEKGSEEYRTAYRFYLFLVKSHSLNDIDGPFDRVISAFMKQGLSFFGATLLDLTVTDFTRKGYAITYQIDVAKNCFEKSEEKFYSIVENLFSIDKDFVLSSERAKYYYFAFRLGFISQFCNQKKVVPVFEKVVETFLDLERTLDKSVVEGFDKGYSTAIANLCSKYFYMLFERAGRNNAQFYKVIDAEGETVIPYRFQLVGFYLSDCNDLPLMVAKDYLFNSPVFNEKILSPKNFDTFPLYTIRTTVECAAKDYKNNMAYINALLYMSDNSSLKDFAKKILVDDTLKANFKAAIALNPKLKKLNAEAVQILSIQIDDFEKKTAHLTLEPTDKAAISALANYDKNLRGWQGSFYSPAQAVFKALDFVINKYNDKAELTKQMFYRINTVFSPFEFMGVVEQCGKDSKNKVHKALEIYIEDEQSFNALFDPTLISEYTADSLLTALELKNNGQQFKRLVMLCLYYSVSKKVITACEKLINSNFDTYQQIFKQWQEKNIVVKKDNLVIIKAIKQKNCNAITSFDNAVAIEHYAENEQLAALKVFKAIDFSAFSPVQYKDGSYVSEKTLQVFYDKYFAMTELYRLPLCDLMAKHFDKQSFITFTEAVFKYWVEKDYDSKIKALAAPYCFYTSNENLMQLKNECKNLCERGKHAVCAYLIEAMAMNGGKYALMLVDNMSKKFPFPKSRETAKNAMEAAAKKYKISADRLGDLIIPDYDFDINGKREFAYGDSTLLLQLMPDGDIKIYNVDKEIKALPSPSNEIMKEQRDEFLTLKKEIKNVVKFQTARFESNLMTGYARTHADFNNNLVFAPAIKGLLCNLIWGVYKEDGQLFYAFRINLDGTKTDAEYNEVKPLDTDIIALVHPCDLDENALALWREFIADNEIKQPFKQISQDVLNIPLNKIVDNGVSFKEFNFCLSHVLKLVNRFNLTRLPVCDGAGYGGYYMESTENDIGVELLLDELYIGCESCEGSNLELTFYCPSTAKLDYWSHDRGSLVAPDKVPTRFVSTLLNALQQSYGADLNCNEKNVTVKAHFTMPKTTEDFSFDEQENENKKLVKNCESPVILKPTVVCFADKNVAPVIAKSITATATIKPTNKPDSAKLFAQPIASNGNTTYLEFVEGTSSKFWKITVCGNTHTVTYGRIGADGVSAQKTFESDLEAKTDAAKLVASKTKKGYVSK